MNATQLNMSNTLEVDTQMGQQSSEKLQNHLNDSHFAETGHSANEGACASGSWDRF